MKPVAIVTDSTSDIPAQLAEQLGIHIIPCNVHFAQEVFRDRVDLSLDQFYEKLASSPQLPKTSQPSVGMFLELYRALEERSSAIVSIHLAGRLSGTLQSAALAAQEIHSVPIATIDSGTASMALGWLAVIAARASERELGFDAIVSMVLAAIPRVRLLALLENLDNVIKGGRIGKGAALLGTLLSVKPLIEVKDGEVIPLEKVRTWLKAQSRLVDMTQALGPLEELAVLHTHAP
ncbi:MAG: DegV family protein, partial [Chloroflexi bacterium]|nr:DegV family protein [Chloroflexota bacterium]